MAHASETSVVVEPLFEHDVVAGATRYRVGWFAPPFVPPREQTRQVLAICFSGDARIVLITLTGKEWSLPGGTLEPGETVKAALRREIWEEACADVLDCEYLGCQLVTPLDGNGEPYYETRYWARVQLEEFVARHETIGRKLVQPEEFISALDWGGAPTARVILEQGLSLECTRRVTSARPAHGDSPRLAPRRSTLVVPGGRSR